MTRKQRITGPKLLVWLTLIALGLSACRGTQSRGDREGSRDANPIEVDTRPSTRVFSLGREGFLLDGQPIKLWGLRCGNALMTPSVTERHVRALDQMVAHGINTIGCYIQGSNGGWPDSEAGINGFDRDGVLKPAFADRLEWLVREADARGMVVMVGVISPRKDQQLADEQAIRRAIESTADFLRERRLRNVFVDLVHEYGHDRIDHDLLREPRGAEKKAKLVGWFRARNPEVEVGVCPYEKGGTDWDYPGMRLCLIQKQMEIPDHPHVINVETQKQDSYENDGVFTPGAIDFVLDDCARYARSNNAGMLFHAAFVQGIGNYSGTAPHPEMGGGGESAGDRGVRFYYEWVRQAYGRWSFPAHVKAVAAPEESPAPTREFAVLDARAHLDGQPVKLWGLRCNNALMSPAVTQRLINNLGNMAAHGVNLISVSLQGTNGGFPDVNAGPMAFTSYGKLIPAFARRLEQIVRAADRQGMVVAITVLMPRKDELLRDEAAVRAAIEGTARFLEERQLRNVVINLFQEFDHPTRIDHEIFRSPDMASKQARVAAWFKAIAPQIEVGMVANHIGGKPGLFDGADVWMIHEDQEPLAGHFTLNTETPDEDGSGNEGVFNRFQIANMQALWERYAELPEAALLFRSPFVEDVRGVQGTGPNPEMGGSGGGASDRGVRVYYDWLARNVGRWEFPRHVLP
jgi:hypothetical protein